MRSLSRRQFYLSTVTVITAAGVLVWTAIHEIQTGDYFDLVGQVALAGLLGVASYLYIKRSVAMVKLRESEARYRLIMDNATDAIFIMTPDGRLVEANEAAVRLTGYSKDGLQQLSALDLIVPEQHEEVIERFRLVAESETSRAERRFRRKDGTIITVEISAGRLSDERFISIGHDVTGRRETEDALRRREDLFRAVSELTSDYVYSMSVEPDGSLVPEWFTGAFERVTGYTVEESHARGGWTALVHPDELPRLAENFKKTLGSPAAGPSENEFRIVAQSGELRHVRAWVQPVWDDAQGRVVRIYGAVSDITEAKALEQDLRESRAKFENLYQRLPIGIYQRTWDGKCLEANPACAEILGYPDVETFTKAPPAELYVEMGDREVWLELLERDEVVKNFEVKLRRYDGAVIWARDTGRAVRGDDGTIAYVEGAIQDITEQKRIEEQLRFALTTLERTAEERRRLLTHLVRAKEDERNRVASDIHDDSVQVMTSVAINLERLARSVSDQEQRETLARLEESVRAAIGRLRKMVFELRPPALDEEGLISALRLYLEEFKLDTGIDYRLESELNEEPRSDLRVVLYRVAQEALTNVRKHSGATRVDVKLARTNGGVDVVVADDGVGFEPEVMDARVPGHIGLSEMRERAEMAGGRLELDSTPGNGARVTVWVPELVEAVG